MTEWSEWRHAPPAAFAVIGDPVAHSRSPDMHNAALRSLGRPESYLAVRVPRDEFALAIEHLKELGYIGLNVTVPLKALAADTFLTDEFSSRCGAANTVHLQTGRAINTDGSAFLDTLRDIDLARPSILLLGAGGSARAIALSCTLAGYALKVFNRTRSRAVSMIEELGISASVVDNPSTVGIDLVVNATSASLNSERLPIKWSGPPGIAYDLMYGDSPFVQDAAAQGWQTIDGKELLVAQGARSLEFWLDVPAPREVMREAIR